MAYVDGFVVGYRSSKSKPTWSSRAKPGRSGRSMAPSPLSRASAMVRPMASSPPAQTRHVRHAVRRPRISTADSRRRCSYSNTCSLLKDPTSDECASSRSTPASRTASDHVDASRHPRTLRQGLQRTLRSDRIGHRRSDAQVRRQCGVERKGPDVAAARLDHLLRYLEMLFTQSKRKEKRQ
jgi:hypothetical protein